MVGLFKIIINFVFRASSSLWHDGFHLHNLLILVPQRCCCWYVFSPFCTWLTPLSPPFIYYMCCSTYYLCVFICFSFFFCLHTHRHNSFNSFDISYHIHRVCLLKVHVVVPIMNIPKYFIFLHIWKEGCLIFVWWFTLFPHVFLCRVLGWDVFVRKEEFVGSASGKQK